MELGYQRQAVAEWRDRHIVASATLLNLKALEARAAFDRDLHDAKARDALFPSTLATARIDALMKSALEVELPDFLSSAALELVAIHEKLGPISQGLAEARIEFPGPAPAAVDAPLDVSEHADECDPPPAQGAWLSDISDRLRRKAAGIADTANAVADHVVTEKLRMVDRLRSAATRRIESAWMNEEAGALTSVQSQVIGLIDETAYACRISLS